MRNLNIEPSDPKEALSNWIESVDFEREILTKKAWDAVGEIVATPIIANRDSPGFDASAMDGIALNSESVKGASEESPIKLTKDDDFDYVDTGDVIMGKWDTVIKIEDVEVISDTEVLIKKETKENMFIRKRGEDIQIGELLLDEGSKITAEDIGVLISGGITDVDVFKKITVGIIPTGDEIISPGEEEGVGDITDSNSYVIEAICRDLGANTVRYEPVKDDKELIEKAVKKAISETDFVIINAGSSAGEEDFSAYTIDKLGTLMTHGVAIKPGRPAMLGVINGKPILGTPGYPSASYYIFHRFGKPMIEKLSGLNDKDSVYIYAKLENAIKSIPHTEQFIPMTLSSYNGEAICTPMKMISSKTSTISKADGFLLIDMETEYIDIGTVVPVYLRKNTSFN